MVAIRTLSYRQARAVEFWIRDKRKSKAMALRDAGYSKAIVRQPHKVFGSPAVRTALAKRGHGSLGIEDNQYPNEETHTEKTLPAVDISNVPQEDLRELREKLEALPVLPQRQEHEIPSYIPIGDGWAADPFIAEAGKVDRETRATFASLSSM